MVLIFMLYDLWLCAVTVVHALRTLWKQGMLLQIGHEGCGASFCVYKAHKELSGY
jgi:hypothetical protein